MHLSVYLIKKASRQEKLSAALRSYRFKSWSGLDGVGTIVSRFSPQKLVAGHHWAVPSATLDRGIAPVLIC